MNSDNFYPNLPMHTVTTLQDAAAVTGLPPDEILALLDAGLEIGHLILYVEAVTADRLH